MPLRHVEASAYEGLCGKQTGAYVHAAVGTDQQQRKPLQAQLYNANRDGRTTAWYPQYSKKPLASQALTEKTARPISATGPGCTRLCFLEEVFVFEKASLLCILFSRKLWLHGAAESAPYRSRLETDTNLVSVSNREFKTLEVPAPNAFASTRQFEYTVYSNCS